MSTKQYIIQLSTIFYKCNIECYSAINQTTNSYSQYFTYSYTINQTNNTQPLLAIHLKTCYFNITKKRYYLVFELTKMLFQQIFHMLLSVIFGSLATDWMISHDQKRFVDG